MSFVYPRTVSVRRQVAASVVGAQPYMGLQAVSESVIASGLRASIQYRTGVSHWAGLPSDTPKQPIYRIFIRTTDRTLIRNGDVIVDDLGDRYQVSAAYWNSLGFNALAMQLET